MYYSKIRISMSVTAQMYQYFGSMTVVARAPPLMGGRLQLQWNATPGPVTVARAMSPLECDVTSLDSAHA